MIAMMKDRADIETLRRYANAFNWTAVKENGLGIVALSGPTQYAETWFLTNSAYLALRSTIESLIEDEEVKEIALLINSPGGETTGLMETAEWLHAQTGKKAIYAFTDSIACSAAYLLASACTAFYSSKYAEVGCCGVMAVVDDLTEANKKWGIFTKIFRSKSAQKKNLSPLTEEGAEALQKRIDELEDGYFTALSSFGRDVEKVRSLEGGTVLGEEASTLGLTDGVYAYEEFINLISETGDEEMNFEEMTNEARKEAFRTLCALQPELMASAISEERERVSSLLSARKAYNAELIDKAVADGRKKEEIADELLALAEKNSPMAELASAVEAQQDVKTPVAEERDVYLAAAENLNK